MVRKSVIKLLLLLLIVQSCSNKKKFNRENEVLTLIDTLGINKEREFAFFLIRTSRCDLCTDVASEIFNSSKNESIALIDFNDISFQNERNNSPKKVIVKPNLYFEQRGVDFGDNYIFIIKNGKISDFRIIAKETKKEILELIEKEFVED